MPSRVQQPCRGQHKGLSDRCRRPRQPASMLADLTPGERAALLHGASSRPRHSGAEAADGKAGGDLASCSSKAWRDGQPSSGHLDSHPSMSASMHGRSRL